MRLSIRFLLQFASVCLIFCPFFAAHAGEGLIGWHETPKEVPPITWIDATGESHTLEANGKPVVVHFWATWCPPCLVEMPKMQAALKDYGDTVLVLPLSTDREAAKVAAFYAANGLDFPVLRDEQSASFHALKLKGLPTTLFLNGEGKEVGRRDGEAFWDDEEMHNQLEALLLPR